MKLERMPWQDRVRGRHKGKANPAGTKMARKAAKNASRKKRRRR